MKTRTAWAAACFAALCTLSSLPAGAAGEEGPIDTDRPDITEASTVINPGRFQIESGVLWEYRHQRNSRERSLFTPTLLRYGLCPRAELRLETDGFSHTSLSAGGTTRRTSGYSSLAPGVKFRLLEPPEGSSRPTVSAIVHVDLPSGSSDFRSQRVLGSAKLAADWDLAPGWALGANLGTQLEEDDRGSVFASGILTASLVREFNEQLRTFLELTFQGPESAHGGRAVVLDGGFAYRLTPDMQLDLGVGTGLSGRTPASFFGTLGVSTRF